MRELAGCREIERGVVDTIEFEREEQQVGGGRGDLVLGVAVEFGADWVGGVAGINEPGVAHDSAELVVDGFVTADGLEKASVPSERCEPALEVGGEDLAIGECGFDITLERRRVHAGVEMGEVPFRQIAEVGVEGRGFGGRRSSAHADLSAIRAMPS